MKNKLFLLVLNFVFLSSNAQPVAPFKPLRYDEDYTLPGNDSTKSWYTQFKYTPLSKSAKTFISFGGEVRYQYFLYKNEDWGDAAADKDGHILTRYLLHADLHTGKYFRSFVQLQSSLANGKTSPGPVEENPLDLHQAFFDLSIPTGKVNKLTLRVGRQEMMYGAQRLVAVRDGPNNRQAFDAVKLLYSRDKLKWDFFYSHYVKSKPGIFDDRFNKETKFWGAYTVVNHVPLVHNIEMYYLGIRKLVTAFDDGTGMELRHSVGARVWHNRMGWRYDLEGLYQFGSFAQNLVSAWTASLNTGYKFSKLKTKPTLGLKTELISGDRSYGDNKLQTFNPHFPRGNYFGLAALVGPANLIDLHPSVSIDIAKKMTWNLDYDAFWRYSRNDGMYAANTSLLYSGKNVPGEFIGQQFATDMVYTPNMFLYFRIECTWFKTGPFLKHASIGKDIVFTGFTSQIKF